MFHYAKLISLSYSVVTKNILLHQPVKPNVFFAKLFFVHTFYENSALTYIFYLKFQTIFIIHYFYLESPFITAFLKL